MSDNYDILVRNFSPSDQYFYVFRQQAVFSGPAYGAAAQSSSLGCQKIPNYDQFGSQIQFSLDNQEFAGAVSFAAPTPPSQVETVLAGAVTPARKQVTARMVTSVSAVKPIDLNSSSQGTGSQDFTTLFLNPIGFSDPVNMTGVPAGAFGINIPSFKPSVPPKLYCGDATKLSSGNTVLASYVAPNPNASLYCKPEPVYFVNTGYQPAGEPITYDTTFAAKCDFSSGVNTIIVEYLADGSYNVKGGAP